MADFGYDVSNYTDVDPIFGTLEDMETLVVEAHKRSIKVLLDFVPNHTSDEHPWFIESRSSPTSDKRDWYIWRDPAADGGPPNNWLSVFGGSAWQLDEPSGQYYLHSFLAKQPDLNWDNDTVRKAMKSAMRFWLDRGVDGFRVDAVDWMSKDAAFRDDPVDENAIDAVPGYDHSSLRHVYSRDGPHLFERLNEMTSVLEEYKDRFMITEAHPETDDKITGYLRYYQGVNPHLSAPFNFQGIYLPWKAPEFGRFIDTFQAAMKPGYVPIYTVGNHDESRIATRVGNAAARTAAVMLLTLPGMAFIYYGEELGMHDVDISQDKIRDPFAGKQNGRDPERTPMQWSNAPQAGFTTATPWLPVSDDYKRINVHTEAADPSSSLNLYKRLLRFRNQSRVLRYGSYKPVTKYEHVLSYERRLGNEILLVLLNFSDLNQKLVINDLEGTIVVSTHFEDEGATVNGHLTLQANEGVVIQVSHD
ncbi:MAG: alpha amylase catalytic region [Candidatus Saccharibacteria bacterium]|nr:alpha amylase catalytic region [Candidatus Saccharibacteria bacterium]